MASLNEESDVGIHEANFHRHVFAVRQDSTSVEPSLLDEAEDIVPASAIQTRGVVPELEQDFFHLEGRWESLDEHRGADDILGDTEIGLREVEDVVPQTGL